MNYSQKIEKQRQRFYGSARSVIRKTLRKYSDALIADIRKAGSIQQVIVLSERTLQETEVKKGLRTVYSNTIPFFANQAVKQLKPKKATPDNIEMDYWQAYIDKFVKMKLAKRITWITGTTEEVFKSTCRTLCDEAIKMGWGIDRVADEIQSALNLSERFRSERIARTEVVSASNEGSFAGAQSTGLDMLKEWIAYIDDRTRDSHIGMNGEAVEMDANFSNKLEYPGDPNGDAAEVINCRCTIGYQVKESNFIIGRTIPND